MLSVLSHSTLRSDTILLDCPNHQSYSTVERNGHTVISFAKLSNYVSGVQILIEYINNFSRKGRVGWGGVCEQLVEFSDN